MKYCLDEHHSTRDVAKQFSIPAHSMIINWIRKYEEHGAEGLVKQFKSSYSGDFKRNVIEYMHENHLSLNETANHFRLAGATRIAKKKLNALVQERIKRENKRK